ncbi:hypothetical protein [uncultured Arsenicicoccus sp.]|uniref:hypothetical protein n=1 Tax=uncultured Arsenicicoccus sp. TaxID=491339 RepID=UPI0025925617|nr:hypothetical protein [uncultured Arsenicicoccus sp.]
MSPIDWRYVAAKTDDGWLLVVDCPDDDPGATWTIFDPSGMPAAKGTAWNAMAAHQAAEQEYARQRGTLQRAEADTLAVARAVGLVS